MQEAPPTLTYLTFGNVRNAALCIMQVVHWCGEVMYFKMQVVHFYFQVVHFALPLLAFLRETALKTRRTARRQPINKGQPARAALSVIQIYEIFQPKANSVKSESAVELLRVLFLFARRIFLRPGAGVAGCAKYGRGKRRPERGARRQKSYGRITPRRSDGRLGLKQVPAADGDDKPTSSAMVS